MCTVECRFPTTIMQNIPCYVGIKTRNSNQTKYTGDQNTRKSNKESELKRRNKKLTKRIKQPTKLMKTVQTLERTFRRCNKEKGPTIEQIPV